MRSEVTMHPEIAELLPWYVNETLSEPERRRVELHLAACGECRREVEILRRVATVLQDAVPEPGHNLYARTRTALEERGVNRWLDSIRRLVVPVPTYARVALAAQLVAIVVLAGVLVSRQTLITLSEGPRISGPAVRLQVIFKNATTVGEIREVLAPLKGHIVDGPSSMGVYLIEIPVGSGAPVVTGGQALRRMRALPLIEFVEIVEERR